MFFPVFMGWEIPFIFIVMSYEVPVDDPGALFLEDGWESCVSRIVVPEGGRGEVNAETEVQGNSWVATNY